MIITNYINHNTFLNKEYEGVGSAGKKVQGLDKS
jgi:hypothetical protein